MQRMNEQFGLGATIAAGRLRSLVSDAKSEYVQLEAAKDLLDRAGYKTLIDRSRGSGCRRHSGIYGVCPEQ